MGECRLSGACAEEPRPTSLTTRSSPDQRRRPHPSTGCGLLVRKPHCFRLIPQLPADRHGDRIAKLQENSLFLSAPLDLSLKVLKVLLSTSRAYCTPPGVR